MNTATTRALAVGLAAFAFVAVSFPVLSHIGNAAVLPNFAEYNIFGLVHDLVGTSDQMLGQAQDLHDKAAGLKSKLSLIEQQNEIVGEQIQKAVQMQETLDTMQGNEDKTLAIMNDILTAERQTVELSAQVNSVTAATAASVNGTAQKLNHLAGVISSIKSGTGTLDHESDQLINLLEESKNDFRLIGTASNLLRILHLTN